MDVILTSLVFLSSSLKESLHIFYYCYQSNSRRFAYFFKIKVSSLTISQRLLLKIILMIYSKGEWFEDLKGIYLKIASPKGIFKPLDVLKDKVIIKISDL